MTGCEKLEAAVREFGVDAALEYFGTPKDLYHLWDEERALEKTEREQDDK